MYNVLFLCSEKIWYDLYWMAWNGKEILFTFESEVDRDEWTQGKLMRGADFGITLTGVWGQMIYRGLSFPL